MHHNPFDETCLIKVKILCPSVGYNDIKTLYYTFCLNDISRSSSSVGFKNMEAPEISFADVIILRTEIKTSDVIPLQVVF